MQVTTLLDAGQNPLAQTIRREIARVISQLELADETGTPETKFAAFLADAAARTPGASGVASVANAATVNVENSAGNLDSPATAVVAAGVLSSVKLAATKTIVTHADVINVENSAGNFDSPATAVVAAGVITGVNLGATKAILTDALAVTGVTVTGSGTTATPTIVAGVLTAIVLS